MKTQIIALGDDYHLIAVFHKGAGDLTHSHMWAETFSSCGKTGGSSGQVGLSGGHVMLKLC